MHSFTTFTAVSVLVFAASFQARAETTEVRGASADRPVLVARADGTRPAVAGEASRTFVADPGRRGAMVAAAKGPAELRRYIQRTRMIYGLDFNQFMAN